jgi:hypothetical protein
MKKTVDLFVMEIAQHRYLFFVLEKSMVSFCMNIQGHLKNGAIACLFG